MMRIALFGKAFDSEHSDAVKHLLKRVLDLDSSPLIHADFKAKLEDHMTLSESFRTYTHADELGGCAILIAVGGDGTVLESATYVRDSEIQVLGVNTGRLGFLSNVAIGEVDLAMDALAAGRTWCEDRILLHVEVEGVDLGEFPFALNEVALMKRDTSSMVKVEVHREDRFVNTYWADGLIIATPTGSTAYSLSAGGPIMMPGAEVLCLTPIAPHNLNVRPLILPLKGAIELTPSGREDQLLLCLDARTYLIPVGVTARITPASFRFKLVNLEHQEFFSTVRAKMHWGLDPRQR